MLVFFMGETFFVVSVAEFEGCCGAAYILSLLGVINTSFVDDTFFQK